MILDLPAASPMTTTHSLKTRASISFFHRKGPVAHIPWKALNRPVRDLSAMSDSRQIRFPPIVVAVEEVTEDWISDFLVATRTFCSDL